MDLVQRLTRVRDHLLGAIEGLDETTLTTEPVLTAWTIKDIVGHVVSWGDEFRSDVRTILEGTHPGYDHLISTEDDFSEWNGRQIAQKRDWRWPCLREDLDRDYQETVELIGRLQSKDFRQRGVTPWKPAATQRPDVLTRRDTESVERLIKYHVGHIAVHARALEKWRGQRMARSTP